MTEYEQIALQHGVRVSGDSMWGHPFPDVGHWQLMEECRAKYSWAIPSEEAINVREYGPFLEVGSGSGYWAYEMATRSITPTDKSHADPHWFNPNRGGKLWYPVFKVSAEQAVETYDRAGLLFCWLSYSESWAHETLKKFKGKHVVYVGEGYGGCTADDGFHELSANWDEVLELDIPQWWGLHDRLWAYTRKTPGAHVKGRRVIVDQ